MELQFIVKLVFIVLIFVESLLFGIIPQKWRRCRKSDNLLSIANAFSGGVFLAIAFVHIIPETAKLYYEYKDKDNLNTLSEKYVVGQTITSEEIKLMARSYVQESYEQFPLPFMLVLVGYACILLIDKVIFD